MCDKIKWQKKGGRDSPHFRGFLSGRGISRTLSHKTAKHIHTHTGQVCCLFVMAEKNRGLMFPPDDLIFVIFVRFIAPFLWFCLNSAKRRNRFSLFFLIRKGRHFDIRSITFGFVWRSASRNRAMLHHPSKWDQHLIIIISIYYSFRSIKHYRNLTGPNNS